MPSQNSFAAAQEFLRRQQIDGWAGLRFPRKQSTTESTSARQALDDTPCDPFHPGHGAPILLNHSIDAGQFASADIRRESYLSWPDLHAWLVKTTAGARTHRDGLRARPARCRRLSIVDAGTVEMVRALGGSMSFRRPT